MKRCKFNRNLKCGYSTCDEHCPNWKLVHQTTLFPKEPKVIRTKEEKGVKTTYYKVERRDARK
uniref:Uncharacterized protein n=1 Tax=viral metagenome TaxID=1070528 RepID=A0A6H1ZKY2_9ZZZZ